MTNNCSDNLTFSPSSDVTSSQYHQMCRGCIGSLQDDKGDIHMFSYSDILFLGHLDMSLLTNLNNCDLYFPCLLNCPLFQNRMQFKNIKIKKIEA